MKQNEPAKTERTNPGKGPECFSSSSYIPAIGITGGIGAGKSVVLSLLKEEYRAAVIEADLVAHELMEPGAASYEAIVKEFGTDILSEDGTINRPSLSAIVFADPDRLTALNAITHPNVRAEIDRRIARIREVGSAGLIAVEAALFIDGGYEDSLDAFFYIYANESTRIRRLMANRGYTEEKCRSILKDQPDDASFRAFCDGVIDNSSGLEELREEIKTCLASMGYGKERDAQIP